MHVFHFESKPTYGQSHVPSFIAQHDDLKAKGIEVVACLSVNDAFVMDAWGKVWFRCFFFLKRINLTL